MTQQQQKDQIREIIVDFRDEALVITGKWKGTAGHYGSFYYDADYINQQLYRGRPSSIYINKSNTQELFFQRNPGKIVPVKDDPKNTIKKPDMLRRNEAEMKIEKAAQCQQINRVLSNRQQFKVQGALLSLGDVFAFVSLLVKEFVDLNFEPGTNLIYVVEHEQFNPVQGEEGEEISAFKQFKEALGTAFKIDLELIKQHVELKQMRSLKSKLMLALDLGTGFYLGTITNVQGCYDIKKEGFYVGQDDAYVPHTEEGKLESTIYINTEFCNDKLPQLLLQQRFGDQKAEETILANTAIFPSQKTENWGVFRFYKRFLYQDIDQNPQNNAQATKNKQKVNSNETPFQVVMDEVELTSELQYILNLKKESQQIAQIRVDILHLFIILLLHMKRALATKFGQSVSTLFDVVRFSMPKKANKSHEKFMQCAIRTGLGLPQSFTLESTMEPEAAFSYIAKLDNVDNVVAQKINEALVADGGDGTFDFLYAKKVDMKNENEGENEKVESQKEEDQKEQDEKRLKKTTLWQEMYSSAKTVGGSDIRKALIECVLPFFGNNKFDQKALQLAQKIYSKIQDLMKMSTSITDSPVDCTEFILPYKDQVLDHIKQKMDIFVISKKESPGIPISIDDYESIVDNIYSQIRQKKPDAANDLIEKMFVKEIGCKIQIVLSKSTVESVDMVMNGITDVFEKSCIETQKLLVADSKAKQSVFAKEGAKDQNQYHCAVLAVGGLAKNQVIQNKFAKRINQLNLKSEIKFCLLFPPRPQSAIVDGIPVQRAEISTRNFTLPAEHFLYFTYTKACKDITPKHFISMTGQFDPFTMNPQFATGQLKNSTELLLKKEDPLHPNSNKKLQDITMQVNTQYSFNFAVSNYALPQFINMQDQNLQNSKICILKSFNVEIPAANVPKEFGLNEYVKTVKCEIHMVFDHKRYHSKPFIQIYGVQDGKKYLIQELGDELWEWYESADALNQQLDQQFKFEMKLKK